MPMKSSRLALLKSGCRVVEQVGFEGLTARAVAKEGNVSTQPIYLAFRNMTELREEVKDYLFHEIQQTYFKKNASLCEFLKNYLQFVQGQPKLYLSLVLNRSEIHIQTEDFFHKLLKESLLSEKRELKEVESELLLSRINGTMVYLIERTKKNLLISEEQIIQLVLQDSQLIQTW